MRLKEIGLGKFAVSVFWESGCQVHYGIIVPLHTCATMKKTSKALCVLINKFYYHDHSDWYKTFPEAFEAKMAEIMGESAPQNLFRGVESRKNAFDTLKKVNELNRFFLHYTRSKNGRKSKIDDPRIARLKRSVCRMENLLKFRCPPLIEKEKELIAKVLTEIL